jgi:hypothetical protein
MRSVFTRVLLVAVGNSCFAIGALATCTSPKNAIEAENCLPGNPPGQWLVPGGGSPDIQGFATDISVNVGQTVFFKISTNAVSYSIDIYRLGYYQGLGARLVASVSPSSPLPQVQPPCLSDSSTGLTDCGNWAVSASWAVPTAAASGIYFARLTRQDTGESSAIVFIVRNDSSHFDILVQTSDPTWQAYNNYGGNSLYVGSPAGRAYKVSYNRPATYGDFYSSEYPMIRFLEANGYNVTYFTGLDADRNGALIQQHKIFMSVGHDEYWSGGQRANVEAARAAGVNLAFFSGNEIFWKTRWEASIDGTSTPFRTLVCYKESLAGAVIDPADPPTWTGMWRDPRFSPPADGGRPENALSGTLPWVSSPRNDSITVLQGDGRMRFWRNTSIGSLAPGLVATLPAGTLGPEWDIDQDNGFRPAGLFPLSTTTLTVPTCILSYTTIGTCTAIHRLTLYRASSGALVFGAGTERWSWGLDSNNGATGAPTDPNMQQATVNLLADMGAQPATLQSGLVPATASTDTTPPTSTITSPLSGGAVNANSSVTISGSATDFGGGGVAAVEVSVDGGKTWHPAQGRESWSYTFVPASSGPLTIQSRAVDDSGNLEVPRSPMSLTVSAPSCPCTIWPATASPNVADSGAYSPLELGVQFRADINGYIAGIRFYKSASNTGTHVGSLWSSAGALLSSATFTSETSSGWQQVNFPNPVAITANAVYVASFHTNVGHFALDQNYFASSGVDNPPLHALPNNGGTMNGVYSFAASSAFPSNTYNSSNFWVDVVLANSISTSSPLSVSATTLPNGALSTPYSQILAATGGATPYTWTLISGALPAGLTLSPSGQISGTPTSAGTSNFTVQSSDSSSPPQTATQQFSITVVGPTGSQSNALLSGTYAFTFSGMRSNGGASSAFAAVGRFTADGAGNLANGELDSNGVIAGTAVSAQAFTGTYSIGTDNRGVMTWNVSGNSLQFAFALTASGSAQFIKMDASTGFGTIGSGTLERVDTTAYRASQIIGDYAFGFAGLDPLNNRAAITGRFTSDGAGTLNNPAGDLDAYGTIDPMNFTSANYNVTDTTTGRGAMNLTFTFGGAAANLNFVFYIVNSNKLFVMERDAVSTATPLVIGAVLRQQTPQGGFSNASLNASSVIYLTGQSLCGSTTPVPKTVVGLLTADGNGGLTLTYDENYCGAPNSVTGASGNYVATSNGRATLSLGGYNLIAYLTGQNQFFLFVADSNVLFGLGEPQAAQSFANGSLNGPYSGLTLTPATFDVTVSSGEFTADGSSPTGNLVGTEDVNSSNGPSPGVSFKSTYSVTPSPTNGRGTLTVTSPTGETAVLYMISPSKFVGIPLSQPNPAVLLFEQAPATAPAPTLSSLTLNPTTVVGGAQNSTGTVTLSGPAPSGGATFTLSSSSTNVASVPASVTVPAGSTSALFTITTTAVAASTQVVISVSNGSATQTATLTVTPAPNYTLSASPNSLSIMQGTSGTSTITITPQNGFSGSVSLSASGLPSGVAASFSPNPTTTASTLTLIASSTSATGTFTVIITGTSGSLHSSTTISFTVAPIPLPTVSLLTLNPASVVGGLGSVTGTVTLSGPAPAGGAVVQLSSSNGAAQVPSSVTVPAGATNATFSVTTSIVLITTSAQISASYNSTTRAATLSLLL